METLALSAAIFLSLWSPASVASVHWLASSAADPTKPEVRENTCRCRLEYFFASRVLQPSIPQISTQSPTSTHRIVHNRRPKFSETPSRAVSLPGLKSTRSRFQYVQHAQLFNCTWVSHSSRSQRCRMMSLPLPSSYSYYDC
jgi:hypothetical protein